MPKLKKQEFLCKPKAGEIYKFSSDVSVNAQGLFVFTVPEELMDTINLLRKSDLFKGIGITAGVSRSGKFNVYSPRFENGKSFIRAVLAAFTECEIRTERVILFGYNLDVAYAKSAMGSFHPNVYLANADSGDTGVANANSSTWNGNLNATSNRDYYSVGIVARAFDKVTYRRPTGETSEFKQVEDASKDSFLAKLNAFVGLHFYFGFARERFKEIPYSEEAAEFFYRIMLGLCKMADQIGEFLGDTERVVEAIETKKQLSLPDMTK